MVRTKKIIVILAVCACSLAVGFGRSDGQNSSTQPAAGDKKLASTQPTSQPIEKKDKSVLMNMTFDDLPEGNVEAHRREIYKLNRTVWITHNKKSDFDITSDYPDQPWVKEKNGKALRISKLSKTRDNASYIIFEGYLERYVIVEFDIYLPDAKSPFRMMLTYISTFNHSNCGPEVWQIYKPALSTKFNFTPYSSKAKTAGSSFPVVMGGWMRYRIETDTEKKTVSLWIGQPEGKMRLVKKNARFDIPGPVFCNTIWLKLDSGYSDKDIYVDNIKVYERVEGKNNESQK